jgi:hypothetical protein
VLVELTKKNHFRTHLLSRLLLTSTCRIASYRHSRSVEIVLSSGVTERNCVDSILETRREWVLWRDSVKKDQSYEGKRDRAGFQKGEWVRKSFRSSHLYPMSRMLACKRLAKSLHWASSANPCIGIQKPPLKKCEIIRGKRDNQKGCSIAKTLF